jgi:hypothetical protein
MRIEALRLLAIPAMLVGALAALGGCPGELSNKEEFEAYAASHGDAGAPPSQAGSSSGKAGSSSGTAGSTGAAGSSACGDVVTRIFAGSCGGTGCHSAVGAQQGLDLVSPGVASRVVGVAAKQCLQVLADPANPEQSLMYTKLLTRPDCGAQMPLARPPLSSKDVACVRDWIAAQ